MSRFEPTEKKSTQSTRWWLTLFLFGVGIGSFVLLATSFIIFANTLPAAHNANAPLDEITLLPADGIVVFTGTAPERIEVGLRLLQAGFGKRLLISGLYDTQGFGSVRALLAKQSQADEADIYEKIRCCLDLDYRAKNTAQNATQTASWADIHNMQSLIIVTSAHHVPRARLEVRRAMARVRLSTYAVAPANVHFSAWWRYRGTFQLIAGEYLRYWGALLGLPFRA